jgi:hypothetical protein
MDWLTVGTLVAKVGIEAADFIIRKQAVANAPVTLAEWDELRALAKQTPQTQIASVAASLGLSPDDPRVVELLALAAAK